ncbi:MAG: ORF6N domain-containing protein [Bacteroidia bacterium]
MSKKVLSAIEPLEHYLVSFRRKQVVLDAHVAMLYGVQTRDVNKAVKNNPKKFPKGYVIQLTDKELQSLRWKISTANLSRRRSLPYVFTEKGLYMLATILKSKQATKATLEIIETYHKIRAFGKVAKQLALEKDKNQQQKLIKKSGTLISDILNREFDPNAASETTIELNLAMLKIKHTIKKDAKK